MATGKGLASIVAKEVRSIEGLEFHGAAKFRYLNGPGSTPDFFYRGEGHTIDQYQNQNEEGAGSADGGGCLSCPREQPEDGGRAPGDESRIISIAVEKNF